MVGLFEVTTSWNIPSGVATKTYMYFLPDVSLSQVRAALGVFWDSVANSVSSQVYWSVDPEGRIIEDTTGQLVNQWSDPTVVAGQGKVSGQPVPDAAQANIQWSTGQVIAGRFVNGRTYVPGIGAGNLSGGNLASATQASLTQAGTALKDSGAGLAVWHRPKNGAGGRALAVVSAVCRSELAVLRGRRNR